MKYSRYLADVSLNTVSRHALQEYEEVTVPPARTVPPRDNERSIPVSELDDLAQGSFPVFVKKSSVKPGSDLYLCIQGYTSLNRIQSIVYPTAYGSNENMLVCGMYALRGHIESLVTLTNI